MEYSVFNHYLHGRRFRIITDHKPIETILCKPIHAAPPRLQRMLLKLQRYDFTTVYRPGSEMVLADTPSRLPNTEKDHELELDNRVDTILTEDISITAIDLINFSPVKQNSIREGTIRDPVLHRLAELIYTGCPEARNELPTDLKEFWCYRDELAVENGVIFKGRQVLIPKEQRQGILTQLHNGHQGIKKTRNMARKTVY